MNTTQKDQIISLTHLANWRKRWNMLHETRFANDFQLAELLYEIRAEFPKGDGGDLQFGIWMKKHLRGARNVQLMLSKAHAFEVFDEKDWVKFGGWQGISFLIALPRHQRERLISALGNETHHYSTIRKRAYTLGIVSKRKGRDSRSRSEERVQALRMFIVKLYKKRNDLPPIPAEVKQALTPTVLSMIPADVRA